MTLDKFLQWWFGIGLALMLLLSVGLVLNAVVSEHGYLRTLKEVGVVILVIIALALMPITMLAIIGYAAYIFVKSTKEARDRSSS